ncbi:MAG: PH domain-containing protein [Methylotenera sp.]|nr:PH domain-containing protein [Oligoflexia bacterium]
MDLKTNETLLYERQIPVAYWVGRAILCATILGAPLALYDILKVLTNKGSVSTERVFVKWGILGGGELDATLDKIVSVSVHQPLFGKLFNYGFVMVTNTAGEKVGMFTAAPKTVKNLVFDAQEKYREHQLKKQATSMAQAMKAA